MTPKFCFIRYDKQKYKNGATELQTKTFEKEPKDSFLTVNLPVASDPAVRDQCACVFRCPTPADAPLERTLRWRGR